MPRGRKPDPPAIRAAKENERRTVAAGPFAELRVAGQPDKPDWIASCSIASAEWDRLIDLLEDRRILSPTDAGVLAAYCSAYSTVARCREELNKSGLTTTNTRSGNVKANALLGVLSGAERSLVSFASELGLSPTARGRVTTVQDVDQGDELDEFLAGD